MRKLIIAVAALTGAAALSACGHTTEQRAATGAIGGAAVGGVLSDSVEGAVIGGVVGGVAGAATAPDRR